MRLRVNDAKPSHKAMKARSRRNSINAFAPLSAFPYIHSSFLHSLALSLIQLKDASRHLLRNTLPRHRARSSTNPRRMTSRSRRCSSLTANAHLRLPPITRRCMAEMTYVVFAYFLLAVPTILGGHLTIGAKWWRWLTITTRPNILQPI